MKSGGVSLHGVTRRDETKLGRAAMTWAARKTPHRVPLDVEDTDLHRVVARVQLDGRHPELQAVADHCREVIHEATVCPRARSTAPAVGR